MLSLVTRTIPHHRPRTSFTQRPSQRPKLTVSPPHTVTTSVGLPSNSCPSKRHSCPRICWSSSPALLYVVTSVGRSLTCSSPTRSLTRFGHCSLRSGLRRGSWSTLRFDQARSLDTVGPSQFDAQRSPTFGFLRFVPPRIPLRRHLLSWRKRSLPLVSHPCSTSVASLFLPPTTDLRPVYTWAVFDVRLARSSPLYSLGLTVVAHSALRVNRFANRRKFRRRFSPPNPLISPADQNNDEGYLLLGEKNTLWKLT